MMSSASDLALFLPLLIILSRTKILRAHGEHDLNCSGVDDSIEKCGQGLLNTSGTLNPALGKLEDGGHAFRQW